MSYRGWLAGAEDKQFTAGIEPTRGKPNLLFCPALAGQMSVP